MKINVNQAIEQLANGLGVAVNELYQILHKQAMISLAFNIFWVILWTGVLVTFFSLIRFIIKKQKESERFSSEWDWDESFPALTLFVGGFFSLLAVFIIPFCIHDIVTILFNTEYYMVDKIISKISGN